ncbi:MAG: dimethylarginine dimethylaminohydrolase family protein, partial [Acidimicrobiia bacterium]
MLIESYGAQSMVRPLRDVLVKRPGPAFGDAFDDPAHGFLHSVDIDRAQREHDAFRSLLESLGVVVHALEAETTSPDLVYAYDPMLVTDRGVIALRSGKPNRVGEETALEEWAAAAGIPTLGRIEAPGTVDGGDTFWLTPEIFCIGRSLRTNRSGAEQLAHLVGGRVEVFDVPYGNGPDECLHLLSVISPVAEDAAAVYLRLLPSALWELLTEMGIRMIPVPDEEFGSQGCNLLAVRPGVVVMIEGNPRTQAALEEAGIEVHTFSGRE